MTRSRIVCAGAVAVTIAAGLGSRAAGRQLPWWLATSAGDALYATMVYWAVAFVAPRARRSRLALVALAVCCAIELSQLVRAPWLDGVRATLPGRLVLGQGFVAFDLVCYAIGVALGAGSEWLGAVIVRWWRLRRSAA